MSNDYFKKEIQNLITTWDAISFNEQTIICLNTSNNIAIYGAGQNGIAIANILLAANYKDLKFIDDTASKIGKTINNIPVLSHKQARDEFEHDLTVIVSIFNVQHSFQQSRIRFESYNWTVLSFIQVGMTLSKNFLPFYFIDMPQVYAKNLANIYNLYELLLDDNSKAELMSSLKFRLTLDFNNILTNPVPIFSYLKNLLPSNCHYIDGGAFDGDTIKEFLKMAGDSFTKISAFEPDPLNFVKLDQYIKGLPMSLQHKTTIIQAGLWSDVLKLDFAANGTADSKFIANNTGATDVTYVDAIVDPQETVLLKLDVEGAEIEAIRGAQNIFECGMAIGVISVYHKFSDLWEIPEIIHSINSGYRFGLQSHANDGIDLTLYAIPPSLTDKEPI